MAENQKAHCPECGAALEDGFIGYFSGIRWYDKDPEGWRRIFPFVLSAGHFIVGNAASTPWIRSRKALKCRGCGTLVLPA
ncbi:MAG: PF20097 family protein [Thermoanaerobaculales bacterium]|nr:PF20097 family protein [Thermoanaerobaculales bacterium]